MNNATRTPAVIVGGIGSTVTLVRSLGRIGVPVHVLAGERRSLAGASRYCRSVTHLEGEEGIVEHWCDWLLRSGPSGAVLLPSGDEGVELIVRHREALLAAGFRLPPTSGETSLAMLDKARTYELAHRAGTPCPRTWTVATAQDIEAIRGQISYPCALKPVHSHLFSKRFPTMKLFRVHDEAELLASLSQTSEAGLEMLVTEIVPGPERYTWTYSTYHDEAGEPVYELTRNKLRSEPVHFGTNCYVVSRRNSDVMELGRAFVQGIGLRGIANVEFKWHPGDRTYKLIECNHRFVNAQEVIRRAGIDVAVIAYRRALGEEVPPSPAWRENVHLWWPERDLRAAIDYRREGELTWPQWVRSLLEGPIYTPRMALDDPGPTLLAGARRAQRLARRLAARARRGR